MQVGEVAQEDDPPVGPSATTSASAPARRLWRPAPARWGSLLQPGQGPTRLAAPDWLLLALLYVLAFSFRWDLRSAQPYIAETWHYFTALHLWHSVSNVVPFGGSALDLSWFFWQRPFLALILAPFAAHSFEAYRAAHIVLVSAVPALGAWVLRSLGTGRIAAGAAGVVLAVHPILLPWGVMVLPDMLVLGLILCALLAAHHGRPAVTAILLWVATWVKEIAFVSALALLVLACWRDGDGRRASLRPFHLGPFARWLLPVVPLAFLPLWVSLQVPDAIFPGFRAGGSHAETWESMFLVIWLAPVPLLGLQRAATRRFTLVAMAWPAFFLLYHYTQDKAMEFWYYVLPASFTVLAVAAALDASMAGVRGPRRMVAGVLGLVLLGLVGIQVLVPVEEQINRGLATPLTGRGQWDVAHLRAFELQRDDAFARLIALPGPDERGDWIAVDVEVSFLYYPLAEQAERVHAIGTDVPTLDAAAMDGWQWAIENATDVTFLAMRDDHASNVATRLAYAECSVTDWPYVLIRARDCQGAGDDLWEQYAAVAGIQDPSADEGAPAPV